MSNVAKNIIEPTVSGNPATLFFLHGLGDTGAGWSATLAAWRPQNLKIICPNAPIMPVTLSGGFPVPSWFDIYTLDKNGPEDEEGIKAAAHGIHAMINDEIGKGTPAERIILGGFSQGGALALYAALTFEQRLAGVIALSCWLPLHQQFPQAKRNSVDIPILQCHGDADPIVAYEFGQLSATYLKSFMKRVQFKSYKGLAHTAPDQVLKDVKETLAQWAR